MKKVHYIRSRHAADKTRVTCVYQDVTCKVCRASDEWLVAAWDAARDAAVRGRAVRTDKTAMSYWWPKLREVAPVPETVMLTHPGKDFEECSIMDGKMPEWWHEFVGRLQAAGEKVGYPCFLRNDYQSGKHSWKDTCFVPSADDMGQHFVWLIEDSHVNDMFCPPLPSWYVREMLSVKAWFHAFWGMMPVTTEWRFFVEDGKITHRQFYWPDEVFEGQEHAPPDWKARLAEARGVGDMAELEGLVLKASSAFAGEWSMDWLLTTDRGWVAIDMAEGSCSYRYEDGLIPGGKTGKEGGRRC